MSLLIKLTCYCFSLSSYNLIIEEIGLFAHKISSQICWLVCIGGCVTPCRQVVGP